MRWRRTARGLLAVACLCGAGPAHAADGDAPAAAPPPKDAAARRPGGDESAALVELLLRADVGHSESRSWVGSTDGSRLGFGFSLDGEAAVHEGSHAFRTALRLSAGLAQKPLADDIAKSRDAVSLEAGYLYEVTGWFGPLARLGLATSLFRGSDVRASPASYRIDRLDGSTDVVTSARLPMTDPLRPLTLTQSLGPLLRPVASRPIGVFLHAGAGGRETFADGQLALVDRSGTDPVEVAELPSVAQLGGDGGVTLRGEIDVVGLRYAARAGVLVPILHTGPAVPAREGLTETMTIEIGTDVGVRLVDWVSVDYGFRAVREPLVLDAFQYQSGIRVTFAVRVADGDEATKLSLP